MYNVIVPTLVVARQTPSRAGKLFARSSSVFAFIAAPDLPALHGQAESISIAAEDVFGHIIVVPTTRFGGVELTETMGRTGKSNEQPRLSETRITAAVAALTTGQAFIISFPVWSSAKIGHS